MPRRFRKDWKTNPESYENWGNDDMHAVPPRFEQPFRRRRPQKFWRPPPHTPWQYHDQDIQQWWTSHRRHQRGWVFTRFFGIFGFITLLITGGIAAIAFLLSRALRISTQGTALIWASGVLLALLLPLLGALVARQAFRRIAVPLGDLMAAADAVAAGDLSVRVPESKHGAFSQMAASFNRMTAELERADQQRRNLTADVAHELRTPLHIIQGNLEGVLDGVYDCSTAHIEATLDETRLLARLVEDLRTLSLAEGRQLVLHLETVDVGELLSDAQTSFSGQAEAGGIDVQLDVAPELPTIQGDIGRLDQVLGNLLSNALRHTLVGGVIVLRAACAPGGVQIEVSDTGAGIPAEDIPFIFDRFWKGERSRSRILGSGSGLGLAIARQLVQAHGGNIEVDSTVDEGTTFTIMLPSA